MAVNPVYEKLICCYESIKEKIPFQPKVALILGSGLGDYADGFPAEGVIAEVGTECPDSKITKERKASCSGRDIRGNYILIQHAEKVFRYSQAKAFIPHLDCQ